MLLVDETNVEPKDFVRFFILGGLSVPGEQIASLHDDIAAIRDQAGFDSDDPLKSNRQSKPDNVEVDAWKSAKRSVVEACVRRQARMTVCVIDHNIARNREKKITHQLREVLFRFEQTLETEDRHGLVIVDRLDSYVNENEVFGSCFTDGLTFVTGYQRDLGRILLFGSTSVGLSHLSSAIDIVVGSFAYCVNDRRPGSREAASRVLRSLTPLMAGSQYDDGQLNPLGTSLVLRPKGPFSPSEYVQLLAHLEGLDAGLRFDEKRPPYP